jgi:hypothetical protein
MKIEPGKEYLLLQHDCKTGFFVKAIRPGEHGPAATATT